MSSQTTEKKQYPSQLNSKTISARIPVQDYVEFLNESINLGISLNDFLLRKIYTSNNKVGSAINKKNELTDEVLNFINNYQFEVLEVDNKEEYWNGENLHDYNNPIPTDNIVRFKFTTGQGGVNCFYTLQQVEEFLRATFKYIENLRAQKEPSLMDIKVQIRSLVRSKIHRNDQDEYLKEINRLLKELE